MIKSENEQIRAVQEKAIAKETGVFESTRGEVPLLKRYIPYFIYKPPFGFPRNDIDIYNVRKIAQSPVFFSIENTLLNELCALDWDIKAVDGVDEDKVKAKIKAVKDFFRNPNDNDESFNQILRAIGRDIIELDSGVMNKVYTAGGDLSQIFTIDGATILKNPDEHGYMGNRADYVPMDLGAGVTQDEVKWYYDTVYKEEAAYFQYNWTGGIWPVPFGRKEIIYFMNNSRSDSIYGRSPAQILYDILLIILYAQNVNLDAYIHNNLPTGIVQILNGNKDQIRSTRDWFNSLIQEKDQFGNNRKRYFNFPITNTEVKYTPFAFSAKDMQMIEQQKWFQQLCWAVMGVTPDEMGQVDNSNRSTANEQSRIFKRKALKPLLKLMEYQINTRLVWEDLDEDREVEFRFDDYDIEEDFRKHELIEKKLNYMSINEIRVEQGLTEKEDYDSINGASSGDSGWDSYTSSNTNTDTSNKDQDNSYDEANPNDETANKKAFKVTDKLVEDTAKKLKFTGSMSEFKKGLKVEQEHEDITKDNIDTTAKIAIAHLNEIPDYYTRLSKMESDATKKAIPIKKETELEHELTQFYKQLEKNLLNSQ